MNVSPVNSVSFGRLHIPNDSNTAKSLNQIAWNKNILNEMNSCFANINAKTGNTDVFLKVAHFEHEDDKHREWWSLHITDKEDNHLGGCDITRKEPESHYISRLRTLAKYCKPSAAENVDDILKKYR